MRQAPVLAKPQDRAKELESVLSSIMTAEEYSRTEHEMPYLFELKAGEKQLRYFGSFHVMDPEDPVFEQIEKSFNEIDPDIVLVEGVSILGDTESFNTQVKAESREQAIKEMGESGFVLKLALDKGIEWRSPEPPDQSIYDHLLQEGFSKEQVFTWDVFRILPQYARLVEKHGFENYVSRFIKEFKNSTNWEEFDYSYGNAMHLGEQILGKRIDVENVPDASSLTSPIPSDEAKENQTVLNRVNEATSLFRDQRIVTDIAEALKTHKRIFIVYGFSHAVMQESALRKLFSLQRQG